MHEVRPRNRHLAIVGPTASGKSSLALSLARDREGWELLSVDSMTVYRGMDVGTAKPCAEDRAAVPYHLLDLVDPSEDFSVSSFRTAAREVLAAIEARQSRAALVGGTALYLRAVVDDLEIPGRWPDVVAKLECDAGSGSDGGSLRALHERLRSLDPVAAGKIDPSNRRRIVRALEVTLGSGRPFSSFGPGLDEYPPTPYRMVGLYLSPDEIDRRIEDRFRSQMAAGWLDEVERLRRSPGGVSSTARQALGYRELLAHIEDGVPLEQAAEAALRRTRRLARRQMSWLRRDPRIEWVAAEADPLAAVEEVLGDWMAWRPSR